ncbi:MAG: ComF family protein [Leptospira sp.]|nr:ComF family protein [Leptospira sp.]
MRLDEKWIQFLFPQECVHCGREDFASRFTGVCKICQKKDELAYFPQGHSQRCIKCQNPIQPEEECSYCVSRNVFFDKAFVLRPRRDLEKKIMNQLKFENQKIFTRYFAMGIGKIIPQLKKESIHGIVQMPSHKNSLKKRPFYAINLLSERLSRKLSIPILDVVEKTSPTHQSGLSRKERFFHARNAFSIKKNTFPITNYNLILIDDVFTTGSSMNEVCRLLLENGASKIFVIIASRSLEGIEI